MQNLRNVRHPQFEDMIHFWEQSEFSELAQAATLAIVAKVPVSLLRHAVAPHPTVNHVWDLLLARESELAPLPKNGGQKVQKSTQANRLIYQTR
jgi:hypothetical protein